MCEEVLFCGGKKCPSLSWGIRVQYLWNIVLQTFQRFSEYFFLNIKQLSCNKTKQCFPFGGGKKMSNFNQTFKQPDWV